MSWLFDPPTKRVSLSYSMRALNARKINHFLLTQNDHYLYASYVTLDLHLLDEYVV